MTCKLVLANFRFQVEQSLIPLLCSCTWGISPSLSCNRSVIPVAVVLWAPANTRGSGPRPGAGKQTAAGENSLWDNMRGISQTEYWSVYVRCTEKRFSSALYCTNNICPSTQNISPAYQQQWRRQQRSGWAGWGLIRWSPDITTQQTVSDQQSVWRLRLSWQQCVMFTSWHHQQSISPPSRCSIFTQTWPDLLCMYMKG